MINKVRRPARLYVAPTRSARGCCCSSIAASAAARDESAGSSWSSAVRRRGAVPSALLRVDAASAVLLGDDQSRVVFSGRRPSDGDAAASSGVLVRSRVARRAPGRPAAQVFAAAAIVDGGRGVHDGGPEQARDGPGDGRGDRWGRSRYGGGTAADSGAKTNDRQNERRGCCCRVAAPRVLAAAPVRRQAFHDPAARGRLAREASPASS